MPKDQRNYWKSPFDSNYPRNWSRTPIAERQLDKCPSADPAVIRQTLLDIIRYTSSGERGWLRDFIEERLPLLQIPPALVKPLFARFLAAVEPELRDDAHVGSWEEVWNLHSLQADYSGYTDDARGGSWLCAEKLCIIHRLLGWAEAELEAATQGTTTISPVLYPTIYRLARLGEATDVRQYVNRFPAARAVKRKIKLHVGPTNSGKTYNALLALVKAPSGFYAGPLRLLAHEVWSRINRGTMAGMNDKGRDCNLLTGEEVRVVNEESQLVSCTVEMIGMNTAPVDVGVVDEIQLLGDPHRGGVWNSTVLGACAHELHLCGEDTVVDLVKRIAAETGDEVEVNHHQRLAPLAVAEDSLDGDWSKIRKGDCVIAFGRKAVHKIKDEIQDKTPLKCVLAYGGLPPETRAEQAKLFNDPDSGYDVLVATDAVGMGLNLYVQRRMSPIPQGLSSLTYPSLLALSVIRRVVFTTMDHYNGKSLKISQVKQLGGRAGRFGLHGNGITGSMATLQRPDLQKLVETFAAENKPIPRARISLSEYDLARVYRVLGPGTKLAQAATLLSLIGRTSSNFVFCAASTLEQIAPIIEEAGASLTLAEKLAFAETPINARVEFNSEFFKCMVSDHAAGRVHDFMGGLQGTIAFNTFAAVNDLRRRYEQAALDFIRNSEKVDLKDFRMPALSVADVEPLEELHNLATTYLWLSYRFPLTFPYPEPARRFKSDLELSLEFVLEVVATSEGGDRTKAAVVQRLEKRIEDRRLAEENRIKYVTRGEVDNSALLAELAVPVGRATDVSQLV